MWPSGRAPRRRHLRAVAAGSNSRAASYAGSLLSLSLSLALVDRQFPSQTACVHPRPRDGLLLEAASVLGRRVQAGIVDDGALRPVLVSLASDGLSINVSGRPFPMAVAWSDRSDSAGRSYGPRQTGRHGDHHGAIHLNHCPHLGVCASPGWL